MLYSQFGGYNDLNRITNCSPYLQRSLDRLYEVLYEVDTIKIRDHRFHAKMIDVSDQVGAAYGRPGDWCRIREGWHVSIRHALKNFSYLSY